MKNIFKNLVFLLALVVVFGAQAMPKQAFAKAGFYVLSSGDTVENVGGYRINPAPVVYTLTPQKLPTGVPATTIVLRGENFVPNSQARLNGEYRPTTYINSRRLLMEVSTYDLGNPGQHLVTVFNEAPGGGYSNAVVLTVGGEGSVTTGAVAGATTEKAKVDRNDKGGSQLTATALNSRDGGNSFMPDTLIEWVALVALIFLGIKLFRKLDKDDKKPLKHA